MRSSLNTGHIVRSQSRKRTLKPSVLSLIPGPGLTGVPVPWTPSAETAGKAWAIHHLSPGASRGRIQQKRQGNSAELPEKLYHKNFFSAHLTKRWRSDLPRSQHQPTRHHPTDPMAEMVSELRNTKKNHPEEELSFVLHSAQQ